MTDDLENTWKTTERQPVVDDFLELGTEDTPLLIKRETCARILLSAPDESGCRLCFKLYRVPKYRRWRTCFLATRAKREFRNMQAASNAGVPVPQPIGWAEKRHMGLLHYNALVSLFVPKKDMAVVLAELEERDPQRINLIHGAGKLLAQMHQGGLAWVTALPRNILVGDEPCGQLLAIDMPYARIFSDSIKGKSPAIHDLYTMITRGLKQKDFNSPEALALLNAYCDHDPASRNSIEQLLNNRSTIRNLLERVVMRTTAVLRTDK
jgi:tRNA A-37 threonylcarbamoyl transferase component Bud32